MGVAGLSEKAVPSKWPVPRSNLYHEQPSRVEAAIPGSVPDGKTRNTTCHELAMGLTFYQRHWYVSRRRPKTSNWSGPRALRGKGLLVRSVLDVGPGECAKDVFHVYVLNKLDQSFRVAIPPLSLLFTNDILSLSTVWINTASQ